MILPQCKYFLWSSGKTTTPYDSFPFKSECMRSSKYGKLKKIDFLLTKPIEAYQYTIPIPFNVLSAKEIYFSKFSRFLFSRTLTLKYFHPFSGRHGRSCRGLAITKTREVTPCCRRLPNRLDRTTNTHPASQALLTILYSYWAATVYYRSVLPSGSNTF